MSKNAHWKKSTVRDFFDPIFIFFGPKLTYWDLSKNRPHKKHCAWARTPPWRKVEIYRFLTIFYYFGAFNRAGKTVTKIGIYSKPPLKSEFYRFFINSRPNFVHRTIFIKYFIYAIGILNNSRPNLELLAFLFWYMVLLGLYSFSVHVSVVIVGIWYNDVL
jgi:hypothetical protein